MEAIQLTEDEANALLAILTELPIKHAAVYERVQQLLHAKFAAGTITTLLPLEGEHDAHAPE